MSASDELIIDTPEQIALEFPLATAGSRFLALALDTLLQIAGFIALGIIVVAARVILGPVDRGLALWVTAGAILLAFLLYYGYFAAFEALWNGQTPGKRWIGLRVISVTGRPIGPFDALLRNLLRIVDQLPGIYAVGLTSIFLTSRNQRLGDLAAGTVVVHERTLERPHETSTRPPSTRYGGGRLMPQEVEVIEAFLRRRSALDAYVRLRTADQLASRIRSRLKLPADSAADDEQMLEDLVAEYRERSRYH